jgi:hypothetical protein
VVQSPAARCGAATAAAGAITLAASTAMAPSAIRLRLEILSALLREPQRTAVTALAPRAPVEEAEAEICAIPDARMPYLGCQQIL